MAQGEGEERREERAGRGRDEEESEDEMQEQEERTTKRDTERWRTRRGGEESGGREELLCVGLGSSLVSLNTCAHPVPGSTGLLPAASHTQAQRSNVSVHVW